MNSVVSEVLEKSGIKELNPVQKAAINAGLMDGDSMVVAAPTASGKTLVSEFAALNTIKKGRKVVYIVPLKALASEKYHEFKEKYEKMGIRVALSIGDLDSGEPWLANFDLIIATSEKFDSLLRHGISWIGDIGLVVVDEVHLLNDPRRGPTLEVTITKLRTLIKPQILALSATIQNYEEIAEWIGAKAVYSDYRPVELYRGVYSDGNIFYENDKEKISVGTEYPPSFEIVQDTVSNGKQALVFVSTRRNTESVSGKIGDLIKNRITPDEKKKLGDISKKILGSIERPTLQCEKLSNQVLCGTAFHHAGLTNDQRKLIEDGFKEGIIKAIAATPTLAWGVNLPAYRVIIRDLKRFSGGYGSDYIPVLEVQQMMGRAGRPKYDKEGEAILIAKDDGEAEYVYDTYIAGESEKIQSKLGVEPVLRMHTLALIASGITFSREKLYDFFSKTFYAHQYGDMSLLKGKLDNVIDMLKEFGFVKGEKSNTGDNPFRSASELSDTNEKLEATVVGKRISELYIDPITANYLIKNLNKAENYIHPFALLQMISNTLEMRPALSIRKKDMEMIDDAVAENEKSLIDKPPNEWDVNYDDYMRSVKTALFFSEWIDEIGEDRLLEDFGVAPGELRTRLSNADWLLYSVQELSLLLGMKDIIKHIRKTRVRMKYGIREELLPFVKLKGVGRARARMLYSSNIKSIADLRKVPIETLVKLTGPKTARNIKDQLNQLEAGT